MVQAVDGGEEVARNGECICHSAGKVRHVDRLSSERLLPAEGIEHLDELQSAAAITVNLSDIPQMKCGLGARG